MEIEDAGISVMSILMLLSQHFGIFFSELPYEYLTQFSISISTGKSWTLGVLDKNHFHYLFSFFLHLCHLKSIEVVSFIETHFFTIKIYNIRIHFPFLLSLAFSCWGLAVDGLGGFHAVNIASNNNINT